MVGRAPGSGGGRADDEGELARETARARGVAPDPALILREDPREMGVLRAIRYVLSIPTNLLLIGSSALGYFFFSGLQTFVVVFMRGHYHISQPTATLLLAVLVIGSLVGHAHQRSRDRYTARRGFLAARIWVPAICYLSSVVLLVPGILGKNITPALWFDVGGTALISAANPPLDAARLDIMPAGLWGRAESVRTFLRSLAQALAPLVFGGLADLVVGITPPQAPVGTHPGHVAPESARGARGVLPDHADLAGGRRHLAPARPPDLPDGRRHGGCLAAGHRAALVGKRARAAARAARAVRLKVPGLSERRGRDLRVALDLGQAQGDFVDEAPGPVFAWLQRADEGVAAVVEMGGRMACGGIVAAADVAALEADPQMQPLAPFGQAVLAAGDLLGQVRDPHGVEMGAAGAHEAAPLASGILTRKVVAPGRESTERAVVAIDDDPPGDVQPEPRPLTDLLGREEGVEHARQHVRRDAGAVVGDFDRRAGPSRRVRIVIVPWPSSASIALSSRFVQTWFSSEPRTITLGRVLSRSLTSWMSVCLSLWPRTIRVVFRPSWMSTSTAPPRSM